MSTPSNTKHLEERTEGTCGCQGCGEGIPWEPWDGVAQGKDGMQPGDPEGEGSSSHELGTPRVRCPCCGFSFPNGQEFPGKVWDAGQQDWQLSTGRATREKKSETDPGGIPLSCSQGKSAGAGGFPVGMSGFPESTPSDSRTHHGCYTTATCQQEDPVPRAVPQSQTCTPC